MAAGLIQYPVPETRALSCVVLGEISSVTTEVADSLHILPNLTILSPAIQTANKNGRNTEVVEA